MNLGEPPFDDIHVRKAVNLALDKAAVLQAWGGAVWGQIATHIMPPTVLGNQLTQSYDPYGSTGFQGDLAKAQAEMKQSRYDSNQDGVCDAAACKNVVMVTRNVAPFTDMEPVVSAGLAKLGIEVKARELATSAAYQTIQTIKNKVPIAMHPSWIKDYADPFTFAYVLFAGKAINPTGNVNYSLVGMTQKQAADFGVQYPAGAVPSVDADVAACEKLSGDDLARMSCWVNLDKKLMEQVVPWVPYLWSNNITIVTPGVTRYVYDQSSSYISLTQIAVSNKVDAGRLD
jgi:peptide/nickel transport system substrate-binding protein